MQREIKTPPQLPKLGGHYLETDSDYQSHQLENYLLFQALNLNSVSSRINQCFLLQYVIYMGQCIRSESQGRRDNQLGGKFNEQPNDTAFLSPNDFPPLQFHTLLTKLKLKKCTFYRKIGVRIDFAGYEQFQMKPKNLINETARWQIEHILEFKLTQYEMRKKLLVLHIIEDQSVVLGTLKINLYHLATGPYHQDFSVPLPKSQGTRLSFNVKIAQMVGVQLKVNQIKLMSKERQFPGDRFAFCVRSIIGDRVEQTPLSYYYEVAFDKSNNPKIIFDEKSFKNNSPQTIYGKSVNNSNKIVFEKQREEHHAKNVKKGGSSSTEDIFRSLFWSSSISKQMPIIKVYVPLYNLHCASFNIVFYYFTPTGREFISECFISLNKLTNFPSLQRKDALTSITWEDRNIEAQVKTFDHGKQSGKAQLLMTFCMQKHLKQMQICVRTQKGIKQSSPAFAQSVGPMRLPEELELLQKLGKEIQNLFIQAANSRTAKLSSQFQLSKFTSDVNKRLTRQRQILMNTAKQSNLMFAYQDEKALLKGQTQLIQLGFRTRGLLNQDRQEIASHCWQVLIALLKRGELTLAYIGFTTLQAEQCFSDQFSQFLKKKKQISLKYHNLMIDLLHITFQSLQSYNCQSQKQFAELFCSYAYFRIPRFRTQVLSAITRQDDPEIEEWRGTQFSLTESQIQIQVQGQSVFSLMFDWQNHFYKILDHEQSYLKTEEKLTELLSDNDWAMRMKKRGGAFFNFVRYWVSYVEAIAVNSKHILWRYFPGYLKILHSFLAEMKRKKIQDYSEAMKRAASSLLSNERLLNPFVLIIFKKTNCNDQTTVINALNLIHLFFTSITNRGRSLPSTFDLKLFLKAIKIILQGDSIYGIGKALLLLYDHYKIFSVQFRVEISFYLITKVFFKLFLHWSPNVRSIFHHILFIRIYHQASRPLSQLILKDQQIYRSNPEYRTQIISRYNKLIVILQNAQESSHKIRKTGIDIYENQAYRKMKKKIIEKRRQISNPSQSKTSKRKLSTEDQLQYEKSFMKQLAVPKMERYNSEIISKSLKVAVESVKTAKKEEVIIRMKKQKQTQANVIPKRKLSFFTNSLENQLVALKEDEVAYIRPSLQQFHKLNEFFIKQIENNEDSIPTVKLQMALDGKELRPEGFSQYQEW